MKYLFMISVAFCFYSYIFIDNLEINIYLSIFLIKNTKKSNKVFNGKKSIIIFPSPL